MKTTAARKIRALTTAACALLEEIPVERVRAAAAEAGIQTGNCFDQNGRFVLGDTWPSSVALAAVYPDGAALREALKNRALPLQAATPTLLATLDARSAIPLVIGLLDQDFTSFHRLDFESWVFYSLGSALPLVVPVMPSGDVLALWARGKLDGKHHVPAKLFADMPWELLLSTLRQGRAVLGSVDKVLGDRPDMQSPEDVMRRLEEVFRELGDRGGAVIGWLIARLGRSRHAPAVPLLQSMRGSLWGRSADEALLSIRTPEAVAPIARELEERLSEARLEWDPHHVAMDLAEPIEATYLLDPKRATKTFAPYFAREAIATDRGAKIAHDILVIGRGIQVDHHGFVAGTKTGYLLHADPDWLDVAASLLRHPRLGPLARQVLSEAPSKARAAALAKVDRGDSERASPKIAAGPPRRPHWRRRYLDGAHEEVWAELFALPAPLEGALREEAESVAAETMRRVRSNVDRIALRLHEWVETWASLDGTLSEPPSPRRRASFSAIEKRTGRPLPIALRAFYDIVGSVDFSLPESFVIGGRQRIDPLVIVPVSVASAETRAWRVRTTAGIASELRAPETPIYLAPSSYMKLRGDVNEVDGHPFFACATAGGVDAVIRHHEDEPIALVQYLRASLRRGGFMVIREDYSLDPSFSGSFADVGAQGLAEATRDIVAGFEPF